MKNERIIMYDSVEAAEYQTGLSGWVSGGGLYFGENEDMARYAGCTHKYCECGQIMRKHYTRCESCQERRANEWYVSLEKRRWDYDGPVYSDSADIYFSDWDDLENYCEEHDTSPEELRLLTCKPIDPPIITESYFDDELSDGEDLPAEIKAAIGEVNKVVVKHWPTTWESSDYAVDLEGK